MKSGKILLQFVWYYTTIWIHWLLMQAKANRWRPFGLVDESWYLLKYQMKHHQVFIRDETCLSLAFKWDLLLIKTTHGNNAVPEKTGQCIISYCFIGEDMSKSWDSCFIRFQTLVDEARSPSFWHITLNTLHFFFELWVVAFWELEFLIYWLFSVGTEVQIANKRNNTTKQ